MLYDAAMRMQCCCYAFAILSVAILLLCDRLSQNQAKLEFAQVVTLNRNFNMDLSMLSKLLCVFSSCIKFAKQILT